MKKIFSEPEIVFRRHDGNIFASGTAGDSSTEGWDDGTGGWTDFF